jgi:predicted GNAT superfamily acetyltransferase
MTFEFATKYDRRFDEVDRIAKEFFQIDSDPNQIKADEETFLYSLEIGGGTLGAFDGDKMIGWSFAFPTNRILMEQFLSNEITEKELFWNTKKNPNYDAIYFCAMYVYPEYRSLSLAIKLIRKCIDPLLKEGVCVFYDPYSSAGARIGDFMRKHVKFEIKLKKSIW